MDSSTSSISQDDQSTGRPEKGEDVIRFILKGNDLPEDCPLAEGDILDYVSHLSSLGVAQLTGEPNKLKNDVDNIVEKTQELATNNYKAFIATADCARDVFKEFNAIDKRLDNVIHNVPDFVQKCNSFSSEAKSISKRWRESSLMLSKHIQLLEFLEIPQLMDNCVRNCCYEEALQLYAYVQRLNKKHGQTVPLISSVANDVEMFQESMMNQLLKELNGNIQLPSCMKVIGYLRRMNKFTETELRIKFLLARNCWLQSIIAEIPINNPIIHMTKIIEANRVNLFDIVTQYRAIFADHQPINATTIKYLGKSSSGSLSGGVAGDCHQPNDNAILTSWINHKIQQFLESFNNDLNRCIDNEFGHRYPIDGVIESCFYFGLSMSRIGADLRPLLYQTLARFIDRQAEADDRKTKGRDP